MEDKEPVLKWVRWVVNEDGEYVKLVFDNLKDALYLDGRILNEDWNV